MEQVIKSFLTNIGYKEVDNTNQENRVKTWLDQYKGKTKDHEYYIYNGKRRQKRTLKSLNIISQSCNDMADFYFNEKLDISIDKEDIQEKIQECLMQNNFLENGNKLMQLTKALGTGALVPYLDNGVLKINYLNASEIIILKKTNDGVQDVLFYSKNDKELIINCHILKDGEYIIYNRKYIDGVEVEIEKDLKEIHTGSVVPKFAMLYTPDVNNLDINSPYGISAYANAWDIVISLDRAYDSLDNEMALGRKRVYVPQNQISFNVDENGNTMPAFDSNDVAFYVYPGKDNDKLQESSFDLRIEQITNAIQCQLNLYTAKVGLGQNFYKFKDGQTYVNTDNIMATNSDLFRKIKKQENIITRAITELCYAIAELIKINGEFSVSVDYYDSIIEDTEKIRKQAQTEYNTGLISAVQYYMDVYKMDEPNAIEYLKKVREHKKLETEISGVDLEEE